MGANNTIPIPDNHEELDYIGSDLRLMFAIWNSATAIVGSLGNLVTILSILICKKLWTVPNVYIAHLAIVDFIVCASIIPLGIRSFLSGKPPEHCEVLGYATVMCLAASLYTLLAVSLNRYILVCKGKTLYSKMYRKRNVYLSIPLIWLLSIIVLIPVWAGYGRFSFNTKFNACLYIAYDFDTYIYRVIVLSGMVFSISVTFTAYAYINIIRTLRNSQRRLQVYNKKPHKTVSGVPASQLESAHRKSTVADSDSVENSMESAEYHSVNNNKTKTRHTRSNSARRAMKVVVNLAAVFLAFVICWGPQGFIYVIDMNGSLPAVWYTVTLSLAFMNSAVNVFIYALLSPPHRQAFHNLFTCRFKKMRE